MLVSLLSWTGIRWGTTESVRERALREQSEHLKHTALIGATIPTASTRLLDASSINADGEAAPSGMSVSSSKRAYGATATVAAGTVATAAAAASKPAEGSVAPPSEEEQIKLDFAGLSADELEQQLKLLQDARSRRRVFYVLLFAFMQGQSFYCGVKLVDFAFSALASVELQAALMGAMIFLINLEHFTLHHMVTLVTDPDGLRLPSLHHHELFFDDTNKGHYCDLCSDRIKNGFRCKECDFDTCNACFSRKNAKNRAENQMRGDKGEKETADISNYSYMLRGLRMAARHWALIGLALVCLLTTALTRLFLPDFQGDILDSVITKDRGGFHRQVIYFLALSIATGAFGAVSRCVQSDLQSIVYWIHFSTRQSLARAL